MINCVYVADDKLPTSPTHVSRDAFCHSRLIQLLPLSITEVHRQGDELQVGTRRKEVGEKFIELSN
jgi:hypothetical protein